MSNAVMVLSETLSTVDESEPLPVREPFVAELADGCVAMRARLEKVINGTTDEVGTTELDWPFRMQALWNLNMKGQSSEHVKRTPYLAAGCKDGSIVHPSGLQRTGASQGILSHVLGLDGCMPTYTGVVPVAVLLLATMALSTMTCHRCIVAATWCRAANLLPQTTSKHASLWLMWCMHDASLAWST